MSSGNNSLEIQKQLSGKIKENDELKKMISNLETRLKAAEDNEKTLKKKIGEIPSKSGATPNSIKMESVSSYFKNVIDSFEKNLKTSKDSSVDYVIGNMDVELKTHLLSDDSGNAIITTPDPTNSDVSKESLSTIRFSIKPIPKEPIK